MGNQKKFLKNLVDILNNNDFYDIISWTEDGKQIVMKHPKIFEEKVMPEYFNSTKVTTFYRQLNQYGFKFKQNQSKEKMFWFESFYRENDNKLILFRRKKAENEENEEDDNLYSENKKLSNQLKQLQKQQQLIQAQLRIHTQISGIIFKQLKNILDYCMQDPDCTEGDAFFQAIIKTFMGFEKDIAQDIIEELKIFGYPQTTQFSPMLFPYLKQ